jgi:peptidoglycan hydrolase-like protein with peptidoglycan-binding domain
MADAELLAAIKQAKSKKMFFAFIPKGGSDGHLIVSKAKVPPKAIADAKKQIGGGNAITGKCFGDGKSMVFQVAKAAPSTMGPALKKVIKRDTGLGLEPDIQVAGDADAEEEVTGAPATKAAAPAAAPPAPGAAAPPVAPPAQGNVLGIQKALQKLGYDPGKIDGVMGPHTKEAIKKFQQANGLAADGIVGPKTQAALAKALQGGTAAPGGAPAKPAPGAPAGMPPAKGAAEFDLAVYQAAREKVVSGLKALAGKVAGTKHGSAAGVLKEINSIITRLPAKPAPNELDKLHDYIAKDDTITAAEEVPDHFHDLDIREPLLAAWKR